MVAGENILRPPAKTDRILSAAGKIWQNLFEASGRASNFPRKFRNATLVRRLLMILCVNCHEAADDESRC